MAFTHHRSEGFVLKKEERGEADILYTIFSRDFGKVKVLGRSIRKIKSKLRAGIDIFYLSQFEFIQGKVYKTLTDAIVVKKYPAINSSFLKVAVAQKISSAVSSLLAEEEKENNIWLLLKKTFDLLEKEKISSKEEIILFYSHFFWQLVKILGYFPELFSCVNCGRKIKGENKLYFSSEEGGLICQRCYLANKERNILNANRDSIKIIRIFGEKEIDSGLKIVANKKILVNLSEINSSYLNYLVNGNFQK